jgi:hypothetical protein
MFFTAPVFCKETPVLSFMKIRQTVQSLVLAHTHTGVDGRGLHIRVPVLLRKERPISVLTH